MLYALLAACAAPIDIEIDLTTTEPPDDDRITMIEIQAFDSSNLDRCVVYDASSDHNSLGEFAVNLSAWVDTTVDVAIACDRGGTSDVPLISVNNADVNDPTVDIRISDVPCTDFLEGGQDCFEVTYYVE
ncbi:MAG: hypothetical protein HY565_03410 [Candidatus Kerfeldbacteria bacterium]|nr:hypothetical protein [Candidatus Kerfeldbacteria bacterium]